MKEDKNDKLEAEVVSTPKLENIDKPETEVLENLENEVLEVLPSEGKKRGKNKKLKKIKKKQPLLNRFAKAFFVLGIISAVISLLPVASTFFIAGYVMILFVVAMLTLFTIFLNENFKAHFNKIISFGNVFSEMIDYIPYVLFGSAFFFMLSAVFSLISKKRKEKKVLIILSFIFMVITCVLPIFILTFKAE